MSPVDEHLEAHIEILFNRTINTIATLKGFNFFTKEEYKKFEERFKEVIKQELNNYIKPYLD